MTDAIAVNGTFADIRAVKTRSVVQLVIEVPIEQAAKVVELFGFPQPGREIPVTVFRPATSGQAPSPAKPPKPKRHFHELPASAQAALMCKNEAFRRWLQNISGLPTSDEQTTAEYLRSLFGIISRSELDDNATLRNRWLDLHARFEQETGRVPVQR